MGALVYHTTNTHTRSYIIALRLSFLFCKGLCIYVCSVSVYLCCPLANPKQNYIPEFIILVLVLE